jgi:hypothetical protein
MTQKVKETKMKINEEQEITEQIYKDYTFVKLDQFTTVKTFLEEKNFAKFLIDKLVKGDCVTSSYHIMDLLEEKQLKPSYIFGDFIKFDNEKYSKETHMVPLVVHKYNNEDVLLSFLDISRKIYVTLSPNKPVTLESGQVFVWKNGTVYQVVEDYPFKNKDDKNVSREFFSVLEIVDFQKEEFLKEFTTSFVEDYLKMDSWGTKTFIFCGDIKFKKPSKDLILKKNLSVDAEAEKQLTKLLKDKQILFECLEHKSQETYKDKFKEKFKEKIVKAIDDVSDQYQKKYNELKNYK